MTKNVTPGTGMFSKEDDPDPLYHLTMDNAKKILAIHQRLRLVKIFEQNRKKAKL